MPHSNRVSELNTSSFNLDFSGVSGFFGGDVAVQAMSTVHLYWGRAWLGWYNSPGSYEIAKSYGQLCRSRFWDGIYPGPNVDPTQFFGLDGQTGPKYRGFHSGTVMDKTGHIAYLLSQYTQEIPGSEPVKVKGRETTPVPVTIVDLTFVPPKVMQPRAIGSYLHFILAFPPMFATIAAAIACALFNDWFCFATIVSGALCSGLSSAAIGSATLEYTHPIPADGVPPGDGILDNGSSLIVVLGEEGAVNAVTRGTFRLIFKAAPKLHYIGICSLFLTAQFLAQLLLVPQGTLFGQLMNLGSLGVSWAYNSYLCSLDREELQTRILLQEVVHDPPMKQFLLPSRTAMVVFVSLVLAHHNRMELNANSDDQDVQMEKARQEAKQKNLEKLIKAYLPNETDVWEKWREDVVKKIMNPARFASSQSEKPGDSVLLTNLLGDADTGWQGYELYKQYRQEYGNLRSSSHSPALTMSTAASSRPSLQKNGSRLSGLIGSFRNNDQTAGTAETV